MKSIDPVPTEVIVSFSGGKDSLATLDWCARHFQKIYAFYMYWVKGLEFQENTLRWAERTYDLKILRLPHWEIPRIMSQQILNYYRPASPEFKQLRLRQVEDYARYKLTGDLSIWMASGEKKTDGMARRGLLNTRGPWDEQRGHFYPLQDWTDKMVWEYLRIRKIPTPWVYSVGVASRTSGFRGSYLHQIKQHFPKDYEKMLQVFPFLEAIRKRYELYGRVQGTVEQVAAV